MEPREAAGRVAIAGGTALIGRDLGPTSDAIVIEGSKIVEITAAPDADRVIDATGHTVIPGFIDAHVHIAFADPAEVLRKGVTTVRDLGWPRERIFPLALASRARTFDGPLILAAGPMLTVEGGYPITAAWAPEGTGLALSSTIDARGTVRSLRDNGVAVIKVSLNPPAGNVLGTDLLEAIVAEAHDNGLRVTGHIYGLEQLRRAIDAGVDELAHMLMSAEEIPSDVITEMVERDVTIIPTLSIFGDAEVDVAGANLARFIDAGGRVVYGTDLGNAGPGPGIDELEVTRMEAAGMSVTDIVRAATVDAAAHLSLETKGVIEIGADADLVLVEGEIRNARDLTRVRRVFREGREAA